MPNTFVPRLTSDGIAGNPLYYSKNPFWRSGWGMPNCTCYAWGRFWEIIGPDADYSNPPTLSTSDAEDWYGFNDGYTRSQTPALGAIWCGADGIYSGLGHVGVVEEIAANGDLTISNSGLNAYYWQLDTITAASGYQWPHGNYRFQGFILCPGYGPGPGPGPTPTESGFRTWMAKHIIDKRRCGY